MKLSKKSADKFNPGLEKGLILHGYEVIRVLQIDEIAAWYYQLLHKKTGARHIHISSVDDENTFNVAFKTVPSDSTGVAHILEHTALAGSKKYPVRDPFFSMLKRSLKTFMNAFTASDWTCYPYATQNKKDFYNLLGIYLDAAFFPKIDELCFKQEGIRYEFEKNDQTGLEELVYKGVVFNEMKGAMSSPDQVMGRSLLNALYPGSTYSNNSGGDPAIIPSLTYKQLKDFHARHYHPSNSFFYTYGNLPLEKHLEFINREVMIAGKFTKIDPNTDVPNQPRWNKPKEVTYSYPLTATENTEKKSQVCVGWLTSDTKDTFEVLILKVLEQVLLGNNASPLRKALLESNLGSALSDGSGYDADNRDTMFTAGLKDVAEDSAKKIEDLIFKTLKSLVKNGIEQKLIDSAIHQIEFHAREITNTPYPYGIKLFLESASTYIHGGDPVEAIKFDGLFNDLRVNIASKEKFLEEKIQDYFLNNPHRVLFTLKPDQEMQDKADAKEKTELAKIMSELSEEDITEIKSIAIALKDLQESDEDLGCLPTLEREDIPVEIKKIKAIKSSNNINLYREKTAGINYFAAAAGLGHLPARLLPLIPFFCDSFTEMSTKRPYTDILPDKDLYTGGLGITPNVFTKYNGSRNSLPLIYLSGKCLESNTNNMFGLIEELISEVNFNEPDYLLNLLGQYRAQIEKSVLQNGHRMAISLASRNISQTNSLSESWNGVTQLKYLKKLTKNIDKDAIGKLAHDLKLIKELVFTENNLKLALVGENPESAQLDQLLKNRNSGKNGFRSPRVDLDNNNIFEGWSTSTAVSFVAQSMKVPKIGHEDAPAITAISKIFRDNFLHRELREKGGAYGGFALYSKEDGDFSFGSYRDPHIFNTLEVYDKALNYIQSGGYTEENVKEAILQICAEIDKPNPPGPAAKNAFFRKLIGCTDKMREDYKAGVIKLNRDKILSVAQKYFTDPIRHTAVISSEEKLKKTNEKLKNPLELHKI